MTKACRKIGVNYCYGTTKINLWCPNANKVSVLKPKDETIIHLEKADFGYWQKTTDLLQPEDEYFILLDDKTLPDPTALQQPDVHQASKVANLHAFEWTDEHWQIPAMQDLIIYELHVGTFTPEGTFEAIIQKLDYLLDLGVNAIELMPVAQFPGNRNWGYDGVFPFAVQDSYGAYTGLQELVNACHEKGVAVILDVVYNHLGPEGNYLNDFGPFFTDKYQTPWGKAINFDDAHCDAVRTFYIENVLLWLRDFHIDGLRLDAVHAIKDFSARHILAEIKEHVDAFNQEHQKTHFLIAECDLNDKRYLEPLSQNGFAMDAQWIDEFHHALRVSAGGEKKGYYEDFDGISSLAKAYQDAFVFDGLYSPHRKKKFGSSTVGLAGERFVVFSQNHDQVGNRMLGERSSQLFSFEMQKLMAAAVFISPYIPMLFMGEEWSASSPFQYFISHTNEELIKAVQEGRKKEFAAFVSEQEVPDPQAISTFEASKLRWDELNLPQHKTMLAYYKALIQLRKTHPVFKNTQRTGLKAYADETQQMLYISRSSEDVKVLCVLNFSARQQSIQNSKIQAYELIFDSADEKWAGHPVEKDEISPTAVKIYQSKS
ncbi:malto-oligosyltrehalose trehalohydrolase [Pedobacter glucosidilyticus]|uniref:malto-oligosyltrehalose trehalohydrolase n=1 Tax=Pedobacter glucosidilyticus TaxID=1122941 RepID=UPI00041B68FE|nr:malto-oligosyltrehalose trehalohydrolase [Pedobacter glucosidilyticus]